MPHRTIRFHNAPPKEIFEQVYNMMGGAIDYFLIDRKLEADIKQLAIPYRTSPNQGIKSFVVVIEEKDEE